MAQMLSNLPIGAKIKLGKHQVNTETAQPIIWLIADKNHAGCPANSITLITEKIIDVRFYDAKETNWSGVATTDKGYFDYKLSNINQWLNSDGEAGKWYTAQHDYDNPPSITYGLYGNEYASRPGFLYNFTASERLLLLPTTITNQRASNVATTFVTKVYLPSAWEILGTHAYSDGSSKFAYFNTRIVMALPTQEVVSNNVVIGDGYAPSSSDEYWHYWTRSTSYSEVVRIWKDGTTYSCEPYYMSGVRPCVNLSYNVKVSDATDSDGCYTILSNAIPTISGSNSDIGVKNSGFTQAYSIEEGDGEPVTVTEYLDNVAMRSYVATTGENNMFSVEGVTWLKLTNGNHTLKIVASDGYSESERTFSFVKKISSMVVQKTTPMLSATQPKSILVSVVKNIPTEAIFKVEACNNGFDDVPTWEDITTDVIRGEIYDFTNTTKTADNWGVNIRVTVDRNGAEGACYITEIGGNFE